MNEVANAFAENDTETHSERRFIGILINELLVPQSNTIGIFIYLFIFVRIKTVHQHWHASIKMIHSPKKFKPLFRTSPPDDVTVVTFYIKIRRAQHNRLKRDRPQSDARLSTVIQTIALLLHCTIELSSFIAAKKSHRVFFRQIIIFFLVYFALKLH